MRIAQLVGRCDKISPGALCCANPDLLPDDGFPAKPGQDEFIILKWPPSVRAVSRAVILMSAVSATGGISTSPFRLRHFNGSIEIS